MKITRSALKNLIKEEMNRINEGDEPTVHPYSYTHLPGNLKEPFTMTQAQLGEAGAISLSSPISVSWPVEPPPGKDAPISMITIIHPKSEDERLSSNGTKMFTGESNMTSMVDSWDLGIQQIALAVKNTRPELWALIKKAKEGSRLIKKGKAEIVDGGWAAVEPARTMSSTGD